MQIEISCKYCNKIFKTQDYSLKECQSRGKSVRKFCSQKCYRLWRRDFYRPSEETKQKTSEALKGRDATGVPFEKGHTINNGRTPWNKGLTLKDYYPNDPNGEEKRKIISDRSRKIAAGIYKKVTTPGHKTKIEEKLEKLVEEIGLKYLVQYEMLGITTADIYIPDKRLVIYADGDYWHNYPHGNKRDHYINKELANCNYKVLRFWERDIHNNIEYIKKQILDCVA